MTDDLIRLLASWQLVHETADEGLKAAVQRGRETGVEGMSSGPDAFVDGLTALVDEEKERLKAELASGDRRAGTPEEPVDAAALEEIRFEIGELRGRMETLQTTLDAIVRKLGGSGAGE
jgi:hypothetical protein